MNAVIVGADRLGNIPDMLGLLGIRIERHVTGRASAHQRSLPALPQNTQLLILFTDFLSHNVMRSYRNQAESQGIKVVACRRSASCLVQSLRRALGLGNTCPDCPSAKSPRND
jgi:hypothetical protein